MQKGAIMSYPKNKLERFLLGKQKGERRVRLYWQDTYITDEERKKLLEHGARIRRNTTKLCSCYMCGNPKKFFKNQLKMHEIRSLKIYQESLLELE